MTRAEAREQRAKAVARHRDEQRLCALDFLTWGDERGEHAKRCVHPTRGLPVCSLEYNPGPVPEDEKLYAGSAIGALFGFAGSERFLDDLSRWTIVRKRTPDWYEETL